MSDFKTQYIFICDPTLNFCGESLGKQSLRRPRIRWEKTLRRILDDRDGSGTGSELF
jgi:hypothetical protein